MLDTRCDYFGTCCENFNEGRWGNNYIVKAPVLPQGWVAARVDCTLLKLNAIQQAVTGIEYYKGVWI